MNYDNMNRKQKEEFDDMIYVPSGLCFRVGVNFCKKCGKMFKYHSDNKQCKECNSGTRQTRTTREG